jgi:hypothetical protein
MKLEERAKTQFVPWAFQHRLGLLVSLSPTQASENRRWKIPTIFTQWYGNTKGRTRQHATFPTRQRSDDEAHDKAFPPCTSCETSQAAIAINTAITLL